MRALRALFSLPPLAGLSESAAFLAQLVLPLALGMALLWIVHHLQV
ncbi:MAG: hypothetical protein HQL64_09420 [Magnetococcales bacterium]|nr:hypothetical protein [Magnetococcales bacterium]